jgi:predicted ATPase/class 3 adenylate cyclase
MTPPRSDLPYGTVTFLFTDIEGSTRLLHELGNAYTDVLAEHRDALRGAFVGHGGVEVDTQGDAFFVAFSDARAAARAALAAQAALEGTPVRVRMGIHTGEPIVWAEGYVGVDVHRAARICASAHGGQVVLSERTRSLLDGAPVRDLGLHRLKDLSEPQHLYQLGDGEFPPLRTLNATNLPTQPTALIGREQELEEAGALLRSHRLVTLTGAGGSGKTRLALQLAAEALEDFPHGVFWVPLQAVRDPDLVAPAIAESVGAKNGLADHVGDKRLLLLLDNLEQVIDAAPTLAELLGRTQNAKLLVTSREPLRIAGEHRYGVEPLPELDAVTLFVARARAVHPSFEATAAVAEICRRLDGLPLALELAAARVSLLSADQLLAKLSRALPVLTAGGRDAPARQKTLRATVEWSHELLDDAEQRLFRRLAVFAASFDLDAVEPVCDGELDTLQSLVDKSLVRRWASGRFGMLETVHEYAEERLEAAGESGEIRRRHAEHYLAVAKAANLEHDAEGEQRDDVAAREQDNVRNALEWALAGDVELGLRLAVALESFWVAARPFEGMRWFEQLLDRSGDVPPDLHARALLAYGGVVFITGEFERGTRLYEQSLAAFRALDDDRSAAHVLHRLASSAIVEENLERARALAEESLALHRRFGSRKGEGIALGTLADIQWREGGDRNAAIALAEESVAIAREVGFPWWEVGTLTSLCEWSLELARSSDAERYGRNALEIAHRIGERMFAVYTLALLARIAAADGRRERAGLLWGAVEAEEQRGPIGQWEAERESYAAPVLAAAGADFERGREAGRRLTLDEAVEQELAMRESARRDSPSAL